MESDPKFNLLRFSTKKKLSGWMLSHFTPLHAHCFTCYTKNTRKPLSLKAIPNNSYWFWAKRREKEGGEKKYRAKTDQNCKYNVIELNERCREVINWFITSRHLLIEQIQCYNNSTMTIYRQSNDNITIQQQHLSDNITVAQRQFLDI